VLFGIVNNYLGVQLLIPFGHQRLYSALMVADSLFALASNVVLGAAWGAMGVATAIAVSEVMLTLALVISLWKIAGPVHGVALGRKD
jgi:O-antigen/teichoic acid export membrane protein